jgi:NodT family efflux transporter outer membrane factor (OMF) lipoprotein
VFVVGLSFISGGFLAVHALAHASRRGVCQLRRAISSRAAGGAAFSALITGLLLTACAVGPNYLPPAAPVPTNFKELKGNALKGWKVATPSDGPDRSAWWALYRDSKLDFLIKQVEVSNQTVAADAAAYEQARAVIREAQASLFPTATGSYTYTRTRTGPAAVSSQSVGGGPTGGGAIYTTTFVPQLSGTWDLDIWGKVRRQIESNTAAAQASKADLDYAKLSEQAMLATAYFDLRTEDSLHDLFERTIVAYKRTLTIVQNQFKAGYSVTAGDVATAQANVETTQALELASDALRAQYEHAIAMLIGRPPAELTIGRHDLTGAIPKIPVALPSTLLERNPDIAAAERTMQEQNALIGVAIAGYFPDISLSGTLEWIGKNPLPFNAANGIWSIGAAGTETLFNGGLTSAQVDAARATYWESVANYRQTVLTMLQGVEDQLANIRLMTQQLAVQQKAVKNAQTAVDVYLNQFQAGTVAFTTVVTAELTLLSDEETEVTIRQDLFLASVTLIEDLGGGWDTTLLPTQKELQQSFSLLPQLPPQPTQ